MLRRRAFSDVLEREILDSFSGGSFQTPELLSTKWIPISFLSFLHLSGYTRSRYDFHFQDQSFVFSVFVQYRLEDGVILLIPE